MESPLFSNPWHARFILRNLNKKYNVFSIISRHSYGTGNRPISQIPQCIRQLSRNATFCNGNVHTCAHFGYKTVHCGMWDWCIVWFVKLVYWRHGPVYPTVPWLLMTWGHPEPGLHQPWYSLCFMKNSGKIYHLLYREMIRNVNIFLSLLKKFHLVSG